MVSRNGPSGRNGETVMPVKMMLRLCGILCLLVSASAVDAALVIRENSFQNKKLFGLRFGDGQEYFGNVDRIGSVSVQTYQTAVFTVTEMTVDMTAGASLLRIYHTQPLGSDDVADVARSAAGSLPVPVPATPGIVRKVEEKLGEVVRGGQAAAPVIKDYPITTHARTIEYRVADKKTLTLLFEQFRDRYILNPVSSPTTQDDDDSDSDEATEDDNAAENEGENAGGVVRRLNGVLFIVK